MTKMHRAKHYLLHLMTQPYLGQPTNTGIVLIESDMLDSISGSVRGWKVAQEGTPPPQIEEEEPITIVAWRIPGLRMSAEKSLGSG